MVTSNRLLLHTHSVLLQQKRRLKNKKKVIPYNARTVVDDVCVWLPVHHLGPVHDAGRGAVARGVGVGEGVGCGLDLLTPCTSESIKVGK